MRVINLVAHPVVVELPSGLKEVIPPQDPDNPLRIRSYHRRVRLEGFPFPVVRSFVLADDVYRIATQLVQQLPESPLAIIVSYRAAKALAGHSRAKKLLQDRGIRVLSPDSFDKARRRSKEVQAVSQFRLWI